MSLSANQSTKDKLLEEFHSVVTETEKLLKSTATAGSDSLDDLSDSAEHGLAAAKEQLCKLQKAAIDRTGAAISATDAYAHQHPWQAVGLAAGLGLAVGALIGLSLNRR